MHPFLVLTWDPIYGWPDVQIQELTLILTFLFVYFYFIFFKQRFCLTLHLKLNLREAGKERVQKARKPRAQLFSYSCLFCSPGVWLDLIKDTLLASAGSQRRSRLHDTAALSWNPATRSRKERERAREREVFSIFKIKKQHTHTHNPDNSQ